MVQNVGHWQLLVKKIPDISQTSAATYLRCDGIISNAVYYKFATESDGKLIPENLSAFGIVIGKGIVDLQFNHSDQ